MTCDHDQNRKRNNALVIEAVRDGLAVIEADPQSLEAAEALIRIRTFHANVVMPGSGFEQQTIDTVIDIEAKVTRAMGLESSGETH